MYRSFFAALCCAALLCAAPALAAPQSPSSPKDSPAKVDARTTPVSVLHDGDDSTGARLAMRLKEQYNNSNLFTLTEKDMPKIQILLTTAAEFPSRPAVGSVYSLIWTYKQGEGQLAFLLAKEVGTLNDEGVDALAAKILERTDGLSVKYSYLWK
ncbi:MAG: hypothetical protein PHN64_06280 [Desulfovibrionaceae bacterium]|nr:hypothetical protein [Desulfovibrionaceae bacterium]